jgi:hypothetical protein
MLFIDILSPACHVRALRDLQFTLPMRVCEPSACNLLETDIAILSSCAVNGWHWEEKNRMHWIKEQIPAMLNQLRLECPSSNVHIRVVEVSKVDGHVRFRSPFEASGNTTWLLVQCASQWALGTCVWHMVHMAHCVTLPLNIFTSVDYQHSPECEAAVFGK